MKGFGRFVTKAFLRNTDVGRSLLGEKTLKQQAAEQAELRLQAERILAALKGRQSELDYKAKQARAQGQQHRVSPYVVADELSGMPVIIQFYGNNDPTKMDVFYGGDNGVPNGPNHGHITIRKGVIDSWLLPGPKGGRERIV